MSKYIIAVDLGGTNTKLGLFNTQLKIISKRILPTKGFTSKQDLIDGLIFSIEEMLGDKNITLKQLCGIGMGLPGPVNPVKGVVHYFPNIPGWKEVPLRALINKNIKTPVYIDNDSNLAALAEYKFGAAKNTTSSICVTLGTGVGGGIIINGKIYRGYNYAAGEVGHIPIDQDGPICNCGGMGCLERYIGNRFILQKVFTLFSKEYTLEEISQMAKCGDKRALNLWEAVGRHLGIALTGVVNFFNPEMIVLGGGISAAGKILFDTVKKTIKERAMSPANAVKVEKAKLSENAGLMGAACLVLEGI
ncbi:MAG: ROK family protein [Candidatus Omnitrophota bacterium]